MPAFEEPGSQEQRVVPRVTGNDPRRSCVLSGEKRPMAALLITIYDRLDRFERWFNKRFGWFFTNGMKDRRERRPHLR